MKTKNISKIKTLVQTYLLENSKKYILVILVFLIGIFAGVIIVNNSSEETNIKIMNYINEFIEGFKIIEKIDSKELIMTSVKNNIMLACVLWFAGTTVIGILAVFFIIFLRGLALGYTISALLFLLDSSRKNIKLYKSILKDRRKENIKLEIVKHTIISAIMLAILVVSSFIENGVSFIILQKMIKYF